MTWKLRLRRRIVAVVATLLVVGTCGCDFPGRPDPEARTEAEREAKSFPALFAQNCAGCHGAEGELGPAPPLNDPLFLAIVKDETLESVVTNGRPDVPMPAFGKANGGPLSEEDVRTLVAGIRSVWGTKPDGKAPRYTTTHQGDAVRGAALFGKACAGCHGEEGRGTDPDGNGALRDPAFLALVSDACLRRLVITGRPDLGMPDYASSTGRSDDFQPLTSDDVDDIVALLASWRSGTQDENAERTSLKGDSQGERR